MMGQPMEPEKVQRALAELSGTLDKLEDMFLKRQPFLCGDDISLADLLAICEIMQVSMSKDTRWMRMTHHFYVQEISIWLTH